MQTQIEVAQVGGRSLNHTFVLAAGASLFVGAVLGARWFCIYLFGLAPLSRLQAQAAHGGGAETGVLGGLAEPGNRSWRVRTRGGLM